MVPYFTSLCSVQWYTIQDVTKYVSMPCLIFLVTPLDRAWKAKMGKCKHLILSATVFEQHLLKVKKINMENWKWLVCVVFHLFHTSPKFQLVQKVSAISYTLLTPEVTTRHCTQIVIIKLPNACSVSTRNTTLGSGIFQLELNS